MAVPFRLRAIRTHGRPSGEGAAAPGRGPRCIDLLVAGRNLTQQDSSRCSSAARPSACWIASAATCWSSSRRDSAVRSPPSRRPAKRDQALDRPSRFHRAANFGRLPRYQTSRSWSSFLDACPSSARPVFARLPGHAGAESRRRGERRPITHEDLWLMPRVGAPAVSPDGRYAVFPVTRRPTTATEQATHLWLVRPTAASRRGS
jgi:hypothetical protein